MQTTARPPAQFGIRLKFIAILVIAAVVPLCLGMATIGLLGYRHYASQRGDLFKLMAVNSGGSLGSVVQVQVQKLHDWIHLSDAADLTAAISAANAKAGLPDAASIEERWTSTSEEDPLIRNILENALSSRIRKFQSINPLFAEVLVTDREGRLIAASNKTSDYIQSDESWWQKNIVAKIDTALVEGIHYDESARVFSLDVSMAIRTDSPGQEIVGVIKGVIDASPLLRSIPDGATSEASQVHVIMSDGRILVRLFGSSPPPLQESFISPVLTKLTSGKAGWAISHLNPKTSSELVGYAPVDFNRLYDTEIDVESIDPMYVVVHEPMAVVMRPVNRLMAILSSLGVIVVLGFCLIGMYVATRKIIKPLRILNSAARSIADTARLTGLQHGTGSSAHGRFSAEKMIEQVDKIDTGDEIQGLAGDFSLMARRVMNYHVQLEEELARKTEAIQEDLEMAREFQESLLPAEYPQVPDWNTPSTMALEFFHIYKPTLSVGGDFFHIDKLTDHSVGIFIADVTGHGARAALVTAILRTLVRELNRQADDPAAFLTQMNRQFYDIMPKRLDCIFATAFYLVIDVKERTARFASAGHPSALLIDRNNSCASPILANGEGGPALGILTNASYRTFERPLQHRDAFLLVTDGIIEAPNPKGEEFGWERLTSAAARHYSEKISRLVTLLLDENRAFMETEMPPDDICLVAVEVNEINLTHRPLGRSLR